MLGVGYQAFWQPGVFNEAEAIRNAFGDLNGFHNAYIETLVANGLIGGVTLVCVLGVATWRAVLWLYLDSSAEAAGCVYFVVATVILGFFDVIVYRQHEIFYLLVIVFLVVSCREVRARKGPTSGKVP
jgi:O-antigen ligase